MELVGYYLEKQFGGIYKKEATWNLGHISAFV
jgi:hypothetical protein